MTLTMLDAVYHNILLFKLRCYGMDGWTSRRYSDGTGVLNSVLDSQFKKNRHIGASSTDTTKKVGTREEMTTNSLTVPTRRLSSFGYMNPFCRVELRTLIIKSRDQKRECGNSSSLALRCHLPLLYQGS
ncbi:hypothetical protein WISP_103763 [Willisornis vidua]|uniref:Uncharacterized protein n=1 Tax=Willisornis vidua TaxID=1566151 RepID=A0ABQ9CXP6_9PASS|nr:hypothetical protein WISP_103763 [Willisornis vidua]